MHLALSQCRYTHTHTHTHTQVNRRSYSFFIPLAEAMPTRVCALARTYAEHSDNDYGFAQAPGSFFQTDPPTGAPSSNVVGVFLHD